MTRFFQAMWSNVSLLFGLLVVYVLIVTVTLTFNAGKRQPAPPVDVTFVFDTTGSMQDEINGLLRISSQFAAELAETGSDYRISMVCFGASDEPNVIRDTYVPDKNLPAFQEFLCGLQATGGGHEDQPTALRYAMHNIAYRQQARKVLILITDEQLYGDESKEQDSMVDAEWSALIAQLKKEQFTAYAVCIPNEAYQSLASRTGGKFYPISGHANFTSILMDIASAINASLTR